MAYFGGGGVAGELHPGLQAYIDCFDSAPFPRAFPRGGGIWNQDPILMRDFRLIRKFEVDWKNAQRQHSQLHNSGTPVEPDAGGGDLEDLLNQYIEERGLEEDDFF